MPYLRAKSMLYAFVITVFLTVMCTAAVQAQYPGLTDPVSKGSGFKATGNGLVAVTDRVEGGTIPVGATAQVLVLFRNDGGEDVETGAVSLFPSSTVSANIAQNRCDGVRLQPGAECAVALYINGLQPGQWIVDMLMLHSGRSRLVKTQIRGQVDITDKGINSLSTDIEANPTDIDFESLSESQTLIKPIVFRNITSNEITVEDIYIDASDSAGYSFKSNCKVLDAGQACIATVSWAPKQTGRTSGVLVIHHSGPAAITSVPLEGEFDPDTSEEAELFPTAVPGKGLMVSSQSEVDFGSDIETASAITVSLVNVGDAPLEIQDLRLSGSDNGLNFKNNGCEVGMVLDPVEACPLTLTWSPTRVGAITDDIQVIHNGTRGVLVLPIRGEASGTVSQDQQALNLTFANEASIMEALDPSLSEEQAMAARKNRAKVSGQSSVNVAGMLDGYRITSFSANRAIVNGPGGSRLVFNNEPIRIGGVEWDINIQKDGIEFGYEDQRILLLFDRSLSVISRVSAASSSSGLAN